MVWKTGLLLNIGHFWYLCYISRVYLFFLRIERINNIHIYIYIPWSWYEPFPRFSIFFLRTKFSIFQAWWYWSFKSLFVYHILKNIWYMYLFSWEVLGFDSHKNRPKLRINCGQNGGALPRFPRFRKRARWLRQFHHWQYPQLLRNFTQWPRLDTLQTCLAVVQARCCWWRTGFGLWKWADVKGILATPPQSYPPRNKGLIRP